MNYKIVDYTILKMSSRIDSYQIESQVLQDVEVIPARIKVCRSKSCLKENFCVELSPCRTNSALPLSQL